MNRPQSIIAARGLTDQNDRLIQADELLAELQEACGGKLPGVLAVPELLDLVRQCRALGMRIGREFSAFDGQDVVAGFVRIRPAEGDEAAENAPPGCEILIENWQSHPFEDGNSHKSATNLDEADRACAEVVGYLDAKQHLQFLTLFSPDAQALAKSVEEAPGLLWTQFFELEGIAHEQPLHWRLLDGAKGTFAGSSRRWRVRLLPVGRANAAPTGFELLFIADEPLSHKEGAWQDKRLGTPEHSRLIGSALTPVLRQPIARIIANAETIHSRLAGPIRPEYSEYAGNIASAGQHLSGMLDDLSDLEVVEAPDFKAMKEPVDLVDVAKRAAGILGVRAQLRGIRLEVDGHGEDIVAQAEFRRVLQILINLIGNAIAYSPQSSLVAVTATQEDDGVVSVTVDDQGPGVTQEQAAKIFDKFERLGRDSEGGTDGGSGLGLFISRKLALAMGGDLAVLPTREDDELPGAQFKLTLPALPDKE